MRRVPSHARWCLVRHPTLLVVSTEMIDLETQARIVESASELWQERRSDEGFVAAFFGKERGHRIADLVEEWTVEHLEAAFDVKHEMSNGRRRARSMGDLWLASAGMYNPVNVKAGVYGVGGQPNLVSLAKLTDYLLRHVIDSYYLLFVKFSDAKQPEVDVEMINLLDHLDYVHFDSGPGQMMLRADRFMRRMENGVEEAGGSLGVGPAVERLLDMRRRGDQQLVTNRAANLEALEKRAAVFDPEADIDQRQIELG